MLNAVAVYWFSSAADHRRDAASSLTSVKAASQVSDVPELQLWHEISPSFETVEVSRVAIAEQQEMLPLPDMEMDVSEIQPDEKLCDLLGPFDPEMVAKIQEKLGDRVSEALVINMEDTISDGFWLIISPSESKVEAESILMTLRQKQIDSYLITDGEYRNGITLGVFSERENADGYQEKLQEKGVESVLIPRAREEKTAWLQLPGQHNHENVLADIAAILGIQVSAINQGVTSQCQMSD